MKTVRITKADWDVMKPQLLRDFGTIVSLIERETKRDGFSDGVVSMLPFPEPDPRIMLSVSVVAKEFAFPALSPAG